LDQTKEMGGVKENFFSEERISKIVKGAAMSEVETGIGPSGALAARKEQAGGGRIRGGEKI